MFSYVLPPAQLKTQRRHDFSSGWFACFSEDGYEEFLSLSSLRAVTKCEQCEDFLGFFNNCAVACYVWQALLTNMVKVSRAWHSRQSFRWLEDDFLGYCQVKNLNNISNQTLQVLMLQVLALGKPQLLKAEPRRFQRPTASQATGCQVIDFNKNRVMSGATDGSVQFWHLVRKPQMRLLMSRGDSTCCTSR